MIELPRTFYTISLWQDEEAIPRFGNIREHVAAVHWTARHADEIWSTKWQLTGISHRIKWGGEDLVPSDIMADVEEVHTEQRSIEWVR